MKHTIPFAPLFATLCAVCVETAVAAPTVSNVAIAQDAEKNVIVTYDLDEEAIVTVSLTVGGEPLPVKTMVAGDANRLVAAGTGRKAVWNPNLDWPLQSAANVSAIVSAWTKDVPPDYMVVKLFDDAAGRKRWYYASTNDIPGGVTNVPSPRRNCDVLPDNFGHSPCLDVEASRSVLSSPSRVPLGHQAGVVRSPSRNLGAPAIRLTHFVRPRRNVPDECV